MVGGGHGGGYGGGFGGSGHGGGYDRSSYSYGTSNENDDGKCTETTWKSWGLCNLCVILIIWPLLFILFGVYGTDSSCSLYGYDTRSFNVRDPIWYNCVQIDAPSYISTYLVEDEPELTASQYYEANQTVIQESSDVYVWWNAYLNKGSQVNISYAFNNLINFGAIKGTETFESFQKTGSSYTFMFLVKNVEDGIYEDEIEHSDDYFYIYLFSSTSGTVGNSYYQLNMTEYDLSNSEETLKGSGKICYNHHDKLILYSNSSDVEKLTKVEFLWKPKPAAYVPTFTLLLLFLLISFWLCCFKFGKSKLPRFNNNEYEMF